MEELKKIIDENGLKVSVSGLGAIRNKLDEMIKLIDRNNFITAKSEEKLDKIIEKLK